MGLSELICSAVLSLNMWNADFACQKMDLVVQQAEKYDIEPEVMVALIHTESGWTPTAVSKANACGLTQVIPKWTGGKASGKIKYTCQQLKNPDVSIMAGTQIFGYWLHKYGGCKPGKCRKRHYKIGLCGYNAGFRCKEHTNKLTGERVLPNKHGMNYSRVVLKRAERIKRRMRKILNDRQQSSDK